MGGQIVMEVTRLFPARVCGLVLAATFPQEETADGKRRRAEQAERLLREGMDNYAHDVLPRMLAPSTIQAMPATAAHVLQMMRRAHPIGAAAALRARAERPAYEPVLADLTIPALIVVGDQDVFTTRADADRMHALLRRSELVWMDGVGHMPNLERPSAFNVALERFLAVVSADLVT